MNFDSYVLSKALGNTFSKLCMLPWIVYSVRALQRKVICVFYIAAALHKINW